MESTAVTTTNLFEFSIDPTAAGYLKDAARWAKFLSIIGFIFCGLFIIFALTASSIFALMLGNLVPGMTWFMSIVLIICALVYLFPCLFLYRFASKAQTAIRSQDPTLLSESFKNMRSLFRFLGILTIIGLGINILMYIGLGVGTLLRH